MRVRVLNKPWSIALAPYVGGARTPRHPKGDMGSCSDPEHAPRRIKVRSDLRGKRLLDTLIHELTHAANFHVSEEFVSEFASDVAHVLTRKELWPLIAEGIERDLH